MQDQGSGGDSNWCELPELGTFPLTSDTPQPSHYSAPILQSQQSSGMQRDKDYVLQMGWIWLSFYMEQLAVTQAVAELAGGLPGGQLSLSLSTRAHAHT